MGIEDFYACSLPACLKFGINSHSLYLSSGVLTPLREPNALDRGLEHVQTIQTSPGHEE